MAQNGVELAKAYVQIVPSMEGMQGSIEAALGGTGDIGGRAGASLGEGLTKAFEKAVEFIGDSIQTGMGFDSAMSQVAATMGKTTDEIAELRDYAKEMGAETAFSATQSAKALNFMALAGYNANTSMKMLPNVMNLAAAGSMELARASDMITDSQTALGLSLSETETLVDQMAKTSSTTNTSVSQLGDAMLTIGGTAKNLSGGTEELNQVLGIMADNGIKAGEAGTHLRNIILAMQPTTKDAAEAFDQLGFSAYDSQGNLREMSDIFGELSEKTADMTKEERQDIIGKMFNKTDLSTVNALLDTNAERWDEVAEAIDGADGAAKAMADTQLDNLQGDITLMQSAFEGLQIAISDEVTPDLRELVQTATKGLEWAEEHIHTIIGVVEALGVAVAAVKLPAMIGAAKTAMLAFNAVCAANPLGAVLTAAVGGALLLKGAIDDAADAINEIPDAYEGLNDGDIEFVKSIAEQTDDLAEAAERQREAEERLNSAKEKRSHTEELLNIALERYNELSSGDYVDTVELEHQAELIAQMRDRYNEENAAVGELSAAYVSASESVRTLSEAEEAEREQAESSVEAEAQAAQAAEDMAAAYDTYHEALREALKEAATITIELGENTAELSRTTAEEMGKIIDEYNAMYEAQKRVLDGSVDLFGGFTASTETTFDELWQNLNDTDYYLNDWATAIEQLEDRGLGDGIVQSLKDMGTDSWDIVYALNHATDEQLSEYSEKWEETQSDMDDIADRMTAKSKTAAEEQLQAVSGIPDAKLEEFQAAFEKLGIKSGESLAKGIGDQFDKIEKAIDELDDEALDSFEVDDFPGMETVGDYFAQGIEHGMLGGEDSIRNAAGILAAAAIDQIKKDLKISSPSRIGEELGGFFPLGVAEGIEKDAPRAAKAASDMARKIVEAAEITAPRNLTAIADGSTAALRRASASTLDGKPEGGEKQSARGVTITFNQTNNSPKALSRWDTYRQTKTLLRELKGAF